MKKKGFTLVELMGVMIILGIVALIAVPSVKKMINNSKQDLYNTQITNIKDGLKNWAIDNSKQLPDTENDSVTLTLGQLKLGGYIDSKLRNPKNNKCFGNDMLLIITRYQNNYIYEVNDNSGTENDECNDYIGPYIILNGETIENVEVGNVFIDKGVIAKSATGTDISGSVIKTITGSGNTIDTSRIGNKYTIKYSITFDGETTNINRTVKIVDTTPPVIVIPGNIAIETSATSFDVMSGVSASDNSKETIKIQVKSNISFGIPGRYTITYIAIDSSGNKAEQKRVVTINKQQILSSSDNCIKSKTVCQNGTKINVKVNDSSNYDFYVIKDTGTELTLLIDRDLGDPVEWISETDYKAAGGTNWSTSYNGSFGTDKGPLTALKELEQRTADWDNITPYTYTLNDDGGGNKYNSIIRNNARARMLTYTEAKSLGCNSICPTYLYTNLKPPGNSSGGSGHWLSSAYTSATRAATYQFNAWAVDYNGGTTIYADEFHEGYGVRPVIKVKKNM